MKRRPYNSKSLEHAHWWMAKALDTLAEAEALAPSGQTRLGAVNRLYYTVHHVAVAMLRLVGNSAKNHDAIRGQFGKEWITRRGFPPRYGRLLSVLYKQREKADYGEYVPTYLRDVQRHISFVRMFIERAWKEIPPVSTAHILDLLVADNPRIRDFSFDVYCPKSYYHHTRLTFWVPKGRITDITLRDMLSGAIKTRERLSVSEARDYVLGLNSKVNQYAEQHLLMLDFDNVSTLPYASLTGEPGFFFRTQSEFHYIGAKLYAAPAWRKKMRKFSKLASRQHCELSLKRGYGTLRLTASSRKPTKPAYIGRNPAT